MVSIYWPKSRKSCSPFCLYFKILDKKFSQVLCDKNSSNGASFFDSIWELRPVGTSTFNGKLQLALTHRIHSQKCDRLRRQIADRRGLTKRFRSSTNIIAAWPRGLELPHILLAREVAQVRTLSGVDSLFNLFLTLCVLTDHYFC